MIERQKRGRLWLVGSKRHILANSKYLQDCTPAQESNILTHWDANYLYGASMSVFWPCTILNIWEGTTLNNILKTLDDSVNCYTVEVDFRNCQTICTISSKSFHQLQSHWHLTWTVFSDFQKEIGNTSGRLNKDMQRIIQICSTAQKAWTDYNSLQIPEIRERARC